MSKNIKHTESQNGSATRKPMINNAIERISSPHRTEIRYVLICGQWGYHHKVKLGTNLGVNKINHTKIPFFVTFKMFVIAYTMTVKKLMFFPCDLSVESD